MTPSAQFVVASSASVRTARYASSGTSRTTALSNVVIEASLYRLLSCVFGTKRALSLDVR